MIAYVPKGQSIKNTNTSWWGLKNLFWVFNLLKKYIFCKKHTCHLVSVFSANWKIKCKYTFNGHVVSRERKKKNGCQKSQFCFHWLFLLFFSAWNIKGVWRGSKRTLLFCLEIVSTLPIFRYLNSFSLSYLPFIYFLC